MDSELHALGSSELENRNADRESRELWGLIWEWYAKGGPDFVQTELKKLIARTARAVEKTLKEAKAAAPAKRRAKGRRR